MTSSSHILNTDSIIASGEIASGTHKLVPEDLRARVDAFAGWFRDNGPFTVDQQIAARRSLVKQLARRLSIERDVTSFPQIRDELIESPVFVIGFPRTGTSILHALLASDPGMRGVHAWQTFEPSPPPGLMPVAPQRKVSGDKGVQAWIDASPGIMALHPYWDAMGETLIEDEEIYSLDFRNTYPTMFCEAPALMVFGLSEDPAGLYDWLQLYMQHQQWKRSKKRWAMKGVDHQRYLKHLFAKFPDARCLFPHREPGEFMPSHLAIGMAAFDGINSGGLTREAMGKGSMLDFQTRIEAVMNEPLMDDPRVRHFRFSQFIKDPVALMKTIYGEWGFAWSDEIAANMQEWLDSPANDSARYGRHKYTFEPFGVNWEEEGKFLDPYRARYLPT